MIGAIVKIARILFQREKVTIEDTSPFLALRDVVPSKKGKGQYLRRGSDGWV